MTKKYALLFAIVLTIPFANCSKSDSVAESECGAEKTETLIVSSNQLFLQPSNIFWGLSSNIRSYTYNWTFDDNCTKKNPVVDFFVTLKAANNTLSNPFSFKGSISTCFGVQPHAASFTPFGGDQSAYASSISEIGMQQCYSGLSAAAIYPSITITFNSLGSSNADSLYFIQNIVNIKAKRIYNLPK